MFEEVLKKIDEMNTAPYSTDERNFCYARAINDVRKVILSEQQKEPCECCNETYYRNIGSAWDENDFNQVLNKYCPMCGRKLTQPSRT